MLKTHSHDLIVWVDSNIICVLYKDVIIAVICGFGRRNVVFVKKILIERVSPCGRILAIRKVCRSFFLAIANNMFEMVIFAKN